MDDIPKCFWANNYDQFDEVDCCDGVYFFSFIFFFLFILFNIIIIFLEFHFAVASVHNCKSKKLKN